MYLTRGLDIRQYWTQELFHAVLDSMFSTGLERLNQGYSSFSIKVTVAQDSPVKKDVQSSTTHKSGKPVNPKRAWRDAEKEAVYELVKTRLQLEEEDSNLEQWGRDQMTTEMVNRLAELGFTRTKIACGSYWDQYLKERLRKEGLY
jgi:hypothetical protein